MNRGAIHSLYLAVVLSLLLFPPNARSDGLVTSVGSDQLRREPGIPKIAPFNPAFLKHMKQVKASERTTAGAATAGGLIPSPIRVARHGPTGATSVENLTETALLPRYDLRDPNDDGDTSDSLLTPVRDQGSCDASWAFAAYGALESNVRLILGVEEDYSEDNLKHLHGFDHGPCKGGPIDMAVAYLSRHAGPIGEADDPYDPSSKSVTCTTCKPVRYIDNALYLPARADVSDILFLKQAIVDHGAIATSMYYKDATYNAATFTYYYNDKDDSFDEENRAVALVGWDDDMNVPNAPGPGAFIVRNSNGPSWGDGGYFHVSYYDEALAFLGSLAFDEKDDATLDFNKLYFYDTLGLTAAFAYDGSHLRAGWGANWFPVQAMGNVVAVGFYATNPNMAYWIKIYGAYEAGVFSQLLAEKQGTLATAGWFTIPLDAPIPFTQNSAFGVAVQFAINGTGTYPIPVEYRIKDHSSGVVSNAGESFVSGEGNTWLDLASLKPNANVCIKALVREEYSTGGVRVRISPADAVKAGASWRVDGGEWRSSGTIVTGLTPGDHEISFIPLYLWARPEVRTVSITAGEVQDVDISYEPQAPAVLTVVATDPDASELGPDPGVFTVHRTGPTELPLEFGATFTGTAIEGYDYILTSPEGRTNTIPAGQSELRIILTPINDERVEYPETVTITLGTHPYDGRYTAGTPSSATISIADDERPIFTVEAITNEVMEQNGRIRCFRVTRNVGLQADTLVRFRLLGTAVADVDYKVIKLALRFPPNVSTGYIPFNLLDNADFTGDRTLTLKILPGSLMYGIAPPGEATITIVDNDSPVTVAASTARIVEGDGNPGIFTLTRGIQLERPLTVSFNLEGSATIGKDYGTIPRKVTFPAGESSATITITPRRNAVYDGTRTVVLRLVEGSGYTIGDPGTAQIDIEDDDPAPVVNVTATDARISEPGRARDDGELSVVRTGTTTSPLTVKYEVSGTATAGVDYKALSGSVTIRAGERVATIPIRPLHDTEVEGTETIIVTLVPDSTYEIGPRSTVTVNLKDNDV